MKPGKTSLPRASTTSAPGGAASAGPIAVIRSRSQSTSALYCRVAVTISPFLINSDIVQSAVSTCLVKLSNPLHNAPVHPAAIGIDPASADESQMAAAGRHPKLHARRPIQSVEQPPRNHRVVSGRNYQRWLADSGHELRGAARAIVVLGVAEARNRRGVNLVKIVKPSRPPM